MCRLCRYMFHKIHTPNYTIPNCNNVIICLQRWPPVLVLLTSPSAEAPFVGRDSRDKTRLLPMSLSSCIGIVSFFLAWLGRRRLIVCLYLCPVKEQCFPSRCFLPEQAQQLKKLYLPAWMTGGLTNHVKGTPPLAIRDLSLENVLSCVVSCILHVAITFCRFGSQRYSLSVLLLPPPARTSSSSSVSRNSVDCS